MIHGLSSILGNRVPPSEEDSMQQMSTGGSPTPLRRQYSSTTWLVLSGGSNDISMSAEVSDTEESTSDIPSARLQETLKAKAVWESLPENQSYSKKKSDKR